MSTDDELLTPSEILEGLSAKRARLLLFQIENRTAYLMMQARRVVDRYLTEETAQEQDLAFFEALAQGSGPPVRPTIRDLERYAPHWQSLIPPNLTLRAGLAHLLGQKYRFTQQDVPHIKEALGLDTEGVQQAFARQYQQSLDTIYTRKVDLLEWVRWRWNRLGGWLENLPPFWTAYALTIADTVGVYILALPIALAGVGPLPGVVVLLVMGVIKVLAIAAMAEAVTRTGTVRYQGSYLGRLVADYLGRPGPIIVAAMLVSICLMGLFVYTLAFSLTLTEVTSIRAEVWAGALLPFGIYFARRKSSSATLTSVLVIGAINLGLILILSVLALGHLRMENLLYVHIPFLNGYPFEPALLDLIFGVVFSAYFAHLSVYRCASTVLQRDPSGRSLTWGCIAAQASAMILYILWVVAVNGAIAPVTLTGFSGTVLTPLAKQVGPEVNVFGPILVILAMGIAYISYSQWLSSLVWEWLPSESRHILALGRRQGKLILTTRGKAAVSLTLTYLGLKESYPQFRLDLQREDDTRRFYVEVPETWNVATLRAALIPKLPPTTMQLTLKTLSASADFVRVQLATTMRVRYEGKWDTLGFDFLEMADAAETLHMTVVGWLAGRQQASVGEVAHFLAQTEQETQTVLNQLVEQGVLLETREQGRTLYQVHFAARRRRQATKAIWQALDSPGEAAAHKYDTDQSMKKWMRHLRLKELVQTNVARSWLSLSPLLVSFLVFEWLLANKLDSFSQVLSFLGVVTIPVTEGVLPVLLLLASRRKGDHVPGFMLPWLTHPVEAGGIYLVSVGILFLYGLFLWQDVFQRGIVILVGVVVLAMTYQMVRQGAFARRLVIEIEQASAKEDAGTFTVIDTGRAATQASVRLGYTDGERVYQAASGVIPEFPTLCSAKFHLPGTKAQELRVWLHRVTAEGQSENLPALVKVSSSKEIREFHLDGASKQFVLPLRKVVKKEHQDRPEEASWLEVEVQLSQIGLI